MPDNLKSLSWFICACWLLVLGACTGQIGTLSGTGKPPVTTALALLGYESDVAGVEVACDELGEPATDVHRAMFEALNTYRAEHGLAPLLYAKRLEEAADAHVKDLWERDFFDHINPDGQNPGDRAVEAGFCHRYVGENIAAGQPTVARAMTAWKNSPPHNANMLEERYVYVGMGHFVDPNGRHYWGQLLAFEYP